MEEMSTEARLGGSVERLSGGLRSTGSRRPSLRPISSIKAVSGSAPLTPHGSDLSLRVSDPGLSGRSLSTGPAQRVRASLPPTHPEKQGELGRVWGAPTFLISSEAWLQGRRCPHLTRATGFSLRPTRKSTESLSGRLGPRAGFSQSRRPMIHTGELLALVLEAKTKCWLLGEKAKGNASFNGLKEPGLTRQHWPHSYPNTIPSLHYDLLERATRLLRKPRYRENEPAVSVKG